MNHLLGSKFLVTTLCLLTITTFASSVVSAQSTACQIVQFNPSFPSSVNPGQVVQVNTTLTLSCGQWRTYYTGRMDLEDRASGKILSTVYLNIGQQAVYTTTITNQGTAPQTNGPWNLVLNLYIFEEGSMVTSSLNHSVAITVGPNSANQPVAATTSQSTANVTTLANTVPEAITAANLTSNTASNTALATGQNNTNLWPYAIAALIVVVVISIALIVRREGNKS